VKLVEFSGTKRENTWKNSCAWNKW